MKIIINGENKTIASGTVPELLTAENIPEAHWQSLAVACNGEVIPRASWAEKTLSDGDRIEIVKPFVGG